MSSCPLFVELCAGTAALSLRLHAGRNARPPVSRMGAKTGYADVILRCLGLRPGQGHTDGTRYLWCEPDAGVRLLLHAYTDRDLAQAAAAVIRSWKDEDPRALWERLRAEGPAKCPEGLTAREVARVSLLGQWSYRRMEPASGWCSVRVPCGDEPIQAGDRKPARNIERDIAAAAVFTSAAIHADARILAPREVARWVLWSAGTTGGNPGHGGFKGLHKLRPSVDGFIPSRGGCASALAALKPLPASITEDARILDPPTLPPGTVAYMDPPYQNTTSYAHDLGRPEVVALARRWADAGATVCISEAEPIGALVGDGWHQVEITGERKGQRRTFSKQQREFLTVNRPPAWVPSVQGSLFGAA